VRRWISESSVITITPKHKRERNGADLETTIFPFDVILSDVGGVLLTNGWDTVERAIVLEQFGLNRAEFESRHQEHYRAWELGAIPMKTYLDATVFYEKRDFSADDFFAAMCAQSKFLPDGALGILQEISASDKCMVGALNNEARETNDFRFDNFGLRELFKVALTSCNLGLRKPDAAIYQVALMILDKSAERILFIDDRPENVDGAVAAGMKGIRFEGAEALRRELTSLNVF
jgi:putative hydrolase of the HAD superfamily